MASLDDHGALEVATPPTPLALPENADIQVKEIEGTGRGLFWNSADGKAMVEGTTLLRLDPEMIVLYKGALSTHCHACFASDQRIFLRRCDGCKLVRYCSMPCQEKDKLLHQSECKAMKKVAIWHKDATEPDYTNLPNGISRMAARLIWRRAALGEDWWKKIDGLCYRKHEVKKDDDPHKAHALLDYLHAGQETQVLDGDQSGQPSPNELQECSDLLARINANAFGVSKQSGGPLAYALSSVSALLNHACDPNCSIEYPQGLGAKDCMHVVARKDIKAGEHLTIAYVDETGPFPISKDKEKTGRLMSFSCRCTVCQEAKKLEDGDIAMESVRSCS